MRTYYIKQLAQHLLMKITNLPIVANEIELCYPGHWPDDGSQGRGDFKLIEELTELSPYLTRHLIDPCRQLWPDEP